jgi:hypothetical protein
MTDTTPKVTPIEDGAHRVNGLGQLGTDDGPVELQSIVALCRCGRSSRGVRAIARPRNGKRSRAGRSSSIWPAT